MKTNLASMVVVAPLLPGPHQKLLASCQHFLGPATINRPPQYAVYKLFLSNAANPIDLHSFLFETYGTVSSVSSLLELLLRFVTCCSQPHPRQDLFVLPNVANNQSHRCPAFKFLQRRISRKLHLLSICVYFPFRSIWHQEFGCQFIPTLETFRNSDPVSLKLSVTSALR